MVVSVQKLNAEISSRDILQRIARKEKSAVDDCLQSYGDLIWCVVRKFVKSEREAEIVVQEIFTDIVHFAYRYDDSKISQNDFIALLIRQRLKSFRVH